MAAKKRPMTSLLRQAIYLDDAKPRGLCAALALAPDVSSMKAHVREELRPRFAELDKSFGVKSDGHDVDIWEQRGKALAAYKFNLDPHDSQWWMRFTWYMVSRHVPGFSIKGIGQKKKGAPRVWSDERLAQLFADVEFLRKATGLSVGDICKTLPRKKGYAGRWGNCGREALRKAYAKANKLRRSLLFQFVLCGPAATIPENRIDPIEAAIERYALKT